MDGVLYVAYKNATCIKVACHFKITHYNMMNLLVIH